LRTRDLGNGDADLARELAAQDRSLTRVYIPDDTTWDAVRRDPTGLGDRITTAVREIAKENPELEDVVDISDYNATTAGQRILPDGQLAELIEILSRYRLGLRDVDPEGGETLYDPACGSGGLLIKAQLRLREKVAERLGVDDPHDLTAEQLGRPLQLFGQERENFTYAMGRMNAFLHDMDAQIVIGDTIRAPQFTEGEGQLRTFAKVTANPMWNQNFATEVYETDPYDRFTWGTPPASSADWGWIQHM
jgi:type I restriction enzyme M protein